MERRTRAKPVMLRRVIERTLTMGWPLPPDFLLRFVGQALACGGLQSALRRRGAEAPRRLKPAPQMHSRFHRLRELQLMEPLINAAVVHQLLMCSDVPDGSLRTVDKRCAHAGEA